MKETIEKNKPLTELSTLNAMQWFTTETVVNYFAKAGISKEKQAEPLLDADDPFKDLWDQLCGLAVLALEFLRKGTTTNDIVCECFCYQQGANDWRRNLIPHFEENSVIKKDTDGRALIILLSIWWCASNTGCTAKLQVIKW